MAPTKLIFGDNQEPPPSQPHNLSKQATTPQAAVAAQPRVVGGYQHHRSPLAQPKQLDFSAASSPGTFAGSHRQSRSVVQPQRRRTHSRPAPARGSSNMEPEPEPEPGPEVAPASPPTWFSVDLPGRQATPTIGSVASPRSTAGVSPADSSRIGGKLLSSVGGSARVRDSPASSGWPFSARKSCDAGSPAFSTGSPVPADLEDSIGIAVNSPRPAAARNDTPSSKSTPGRGTPSSIGWKGSEGKGTPSEIGWRQEDSGWQNSGSRDDVTNTPASPAGGGFARATGELARDFFSSRPIGGEQSFDEGELFGIDDGELDDEMLEESPCWIRVGGHRPVRLAQPGQREYEPEPQPTAAADGAAAVRKEEEGGPAAALPICTAEEATAWMTQRAEQVSEYAHRQMQVNLSHAWFPNRRCESLN